MKRRHRPQNLLTQVITLTLLMLFLVTSVAGAAESVLCIEQDDMHLLEQEHVYLADCHSAQSSEQTHETEAPALLAAVQHQDRSCIDIAVSGIDSLTPPGKLIQASAKILLHSAAPRPPNPAEESRHSQTVISRHHHSPETYKSIRTTVLII